MTIGPDDYDRLKIKKVIICGSQPKVFSYADVVKVLVSGFGSGASFYLAKRLLSRNENE